MEELIFIFLKFFDFSWQFDIKQLYLLNLLMVMWLLDIKKDEGRTFILSMFMSFDFF